MIKIKIIKDGKEWYKSPKTDLLGFEFRYENKTYIKIDYANLENANLENANLRYANLRYANLENANLENANLRYANLRYANLRYANLENANLRYANLENANLENANLRYANLENANLDESEEKRKGQIIKEKVIVFKKCQQKIVELELQVGSIVFCINGKKCRTNKAKVVSIDGKKTKGLTIASNYNDDFIYEVGKMVEVEDFDLMYNVECSTGIHFFYDREDAENW